MANRGKTDTGRNQRRDGTRDIGEMRLAAAIIAGAKADVEDPHLPNSGNVPDAPKGIQDYLDRLQAEARLFLSSDMWPWSEYLKLDVFSDLAFRAWCRRSGVRPGQFLLQPVTTPLKEHIDAEQD